MPCATQILQSDSMNAPTEALWVRGSPTWISFFCWSTHWNAVFVSSWSGVTIGTTPGIWSTWSQCLRDGSATHLQWWIWICWDWLDWSELYGLCGCSSPSQNFTFWWLGFILQSRQFFLVLWCWSLSFFSGLCWLWSFSIRSLLAWSSLPAIVAPEDSEALLQLAWHFSSKLLQGTPGERSQCLWLKRRHGLGPFCFLWSFPFPLGSWISSLRWSSSGQPKLVTMIMTKESRKKRLNAPKAWLTLQSFVQTWTRTAMVLFHWKRW